MTTARILKSRIRRKPYVRFGSGGRVSDGPADHNLGRLVGKCALTLYDQFTLSPLIGGRELFL